MSLSSEMCYFLLFSGDLADFEEEFFDKFDVIVVSSCSLANKVWTLLSLSTASILFDYGIIEIFCFCWSVDYIGSLWLSSLFLTFLSLDLLQRISSITTCGFSASHRKKLTTDAERDQSALHSIRLTVGAHVVKYLLICKTTHMHRYYSSLTYYFYFLVCNDVVYWTCCEFNFIRPTDCWMYI